MTQQAIIEYAIDLADNAYALLNSGCDQLHREAAVEAMIEAFTIYNSLVREDDDTDWAEREAARWNARRAA
jgi:hypothetical protein